MIRFKSIAKINLEHDFYTNGVNKDLRLHLLHNSCKLIRQRKIIFRQTDVNEWQFMMEENCAGFMYDDVLEISLIAIDPDFINKISISNYAPLRLHQITLDKEIIIIDNMFEMEVLNEKKQQREFCRIILKSSQIMTQTEHKYTIRFSSPSRYWEYLFIFRDEKDPRGAFLKLEASPISAVTFQDPKKYKDSIRGENTYSTISNEMIKCQDSYDLKLILSDYSSGERKVVSKFIAVPKIDRYYPFAPDIIREIVYL